MKVRILSGNNVGAVVEMGKTEAESAVATGFAEWWVMSVVPPAADLEIAQISEEPAAEKRDDHED